MNPTLKEVIDAKRKAEQAIYAVLQEFSEKTGLHVQDIDISRVEMVSASGCADSLITELKLRVKL